MSGCTRDASDLVSRDFLHKHTLRDAIRRIAFATWTPCSVCGRDDEGRRQWLTRCQLGKTWPYFRNTDGREAATLEIDIASD